jgi:tRNA dimethylallyltransferase
MGAPVDTLYTPPLWAVVGQTASGKSRVALALARAAGGEIISCDSVQIYRRFDIGSAKPSAAERAAVPHHLIDVAAPDEAFDAARYVALATEAAAAVRARGRVPILCGGTGLYLRALRYGLITDVESDPAMRRKLASAEAQEPGSLYRRLAALDPTTAARTEPNNLVHVTRALEICLLTGEPASVVRARHGFRREQVPMRVVDLVWDPRALRARIDARVQAMLAAGLVDEVEALLADGVPHDCKPMQAVGYREVVAALRGALPRAELYDRIARSTWAYARRQRTWLRREPGLQACRVWGPGPDVAAIHALLTASNA